MSVKQLEAYEVPLGKVFSSDFDFRIPDYQRPYSWGSEQAGQLLDDLVDALDRGGDEPYFLGSIVLVKSSQSPRAEVIDGQQRLTTLTILLAVLRDLSDSLEWRDHIAKKLLEPGDVVDGLKPRPRLELRLRDRDLFRQRVQEAPLAGLLACTDDVLATDAQRAIRDNARLLYERLAGWPEDRRQALASMLSTRTLMVVVATPDLDSAHRIFSVMNARGLDLSPADLFKAKVVGALPDGVSDAYATKWEDAEEDLGREDFSDLFLHIRMIFAKERAKRELLKEFPEQVLDRYLPGHAKDFVDDVLVPYAGAYEITRDSDYASSIGAETVNLWLRRMNQLDNNDWRPPAMWALRNHGDDPAWLAKFFSRLERLAASLFIRRAYATPRVNRYAQLLTELADGAGADAPALDLSDQERVETRQRLDGEVYLTQKTRKYVLLRLDQELAGDPTAIYAHPLVTVEHVLPQTPSAGSAWFTDFTEDERAHWTHRLANLVLLNRAKNSEAQNYDFPKKKATYFTSHNGVVAFAITSQVLTEDSWTPAVLAKRQVDLLGVLAAAWNL